MEEKNNIVKYIFSFIADNIFAYVSALLSYLIFCVANNTIVSLIFIAFYLTLGLLIFFQGLVYFLTIYIVVVFDFFFVFRVVLTAIVGVSTWAAIIGLIVVVVGTPIFAEWLAENVSDEIDIVSIIKKYLLQK